jgi:hypothetical protein
MSARSKVKYVQGETDQQKARRENEQARAAFLAEIGHDTEDHSRHDLPAELRRALCWESSCGWWWCDRDRHPDARQEHPPWTALLEALRNLRQRGVEPVGKDERHVAMVAWHTARRRTSPGSGSCSTGSTSRRRVAGAIGTPGE